MKIDANQPIGKLAAEIPGAIGVFEALGIDYACLCDRSLDDAAHAEGIAPVDVMASLRRLGSMRHGETWNERPLSDLTRHLAQEHHRFVRHELGRMAMVLSDVCAGETAPDLLALRSGFTTLVEIVLAHLHREETAVFHVIEAMEKAWQAGDPVEAPAGFTDTLRELGDEHGVISAQLRMLRELRLSLADTNDLPPRVRSILHDLATLEAHFHEYMFLENWSLFPRAAALAEQAVRRP